MSDPKDRRPKTRSITGLILAGGAGRRMGGQDKGMLLWQGQPLARHVAVRLRPQVDQLIISCNRNESFYRALADATALDVRPEYQGPLAGLESVRGHIESDLLLVAPCDTPLLPPDMCSRLEQEIIHSQERICYVHDGNRSQYLCAIMRTEVLEQLPDYLNAGHRAVHQWYLQEGARAVDFTDRQGAFINCNSELDLQKR
ncbi:MAG: molybdenum cofactor guanylyltransferase MobA [Pseudomonadota bacterium]